MSDYTKKRVAYYNEVLTDNLDIVDVLLVRRPNFKFLVKCNMCSKEKGVWSSQIHSGRYEVCEHDTL